MALYKNKIVEIVHFVYHLLEETIFKVFGEDARYKFIYFLRTGKVLHLQSPRDLNEKFFWLSRYWRHPLVSLCADKYRVRFYLEEKGCGDILNEIYGVYRAGEDINFSELPNKFVLKCNHGSRMNYFCENKEDLESRVVVKQLNDWLGFQYGRGIEWQYKEIKRLILAEKFLESNDGSMIEYQIFCFNGEPQFFLVRNDLRNGSKDKQENQYAVSYTIDWQRVFMRKGEEKYQIQLPKPYNYKKMIEYAIILSADFPQVRVDFYEVDNKLIFGELTFSSNGGVFSNYKDEYVDELGEKLKLPLPYID